MTSDVKQREENRGRSLSDYWPLFSLIILMLLAATALQYQEQTDDPMMFMHHFMGFFLVVYSMFKIFDLNGYADGFEMYDLLASRWRPYGYIYPFIELALGLAYLAFFVPVLTYVLTIIVFGFGAAGVFKGISKGLDMDCPCMGSVLSVPLSTVSLVENLGMTIMAIVMLWMRLS
jgi:hypothetical protein